MDETEQQKIKGIQSCMHIHRQHVLAGRYRENVLISGTVTELKNIFGYQSCSLIKPPVMDLSLNSQVGPEAITIFFLGFQ